MLRKRDVISGLLVLIALELATTGCYQGARVGDLQTKSQTIELDDADSVNVEIQMGAGELDLSSGASELIEVDTGIGAVDASGLARNGNTYADDAYDVTDVTL